MDFTELRHLAEQIETECGKAIIGKGEQSAWYSPACLPAGTC